MVISAFEGDAAARFTALVGNLADFIAVVAVGDGQGAVNLDGVDARSLGDSLAIEAKVDVIGRTPDLREGHVVFQVIVTRLVGQAVGLGPRLPLHIRAVTLVIAVGLAANSVPVRLRQDQAIAGRHQTVVRVVAGEACGGARTGYHKRSVHGFLSRNAHGRATVHAALCGSNRFAAGEINVLVRVAHLVVFDGHVTREVERAAVANAAAIFIGRVAGNAAAGHMERTTFEVIDACALFCDLVAGDAAARDANRPVGVVDTSAVLGRVSGDGASVHDEHVVVFNAGAAILGRVICDGAAKHGEVAPVFDATTAAVGAIALVAHSKVARDAAAVHLKRAKAVDAAADIILGRVAGDAAIPEDEGAIGTNLDTAS